MPVEFPHIALIRRAIEKLKDKNLDPEKFLSIVEDVTNNLIDRKIEKLEADKKELEKALKITKSKKRELLLEKYKLLEKVLEELKIIKNERKSEFSEEEKPHQKYTPEETVLLHEIIITIGERVLDVEKEHLNTLKKIINSSDENLKIFTLLIGLQIEKLIEDYNAREDLLKIKPFIIKLEFSKVESFPEIKEDVILSYIYAYKLYRILILSYEILKMLENPTIKVELSGKPDIEGPLVDDITELLTILVEEFKEKAEIRIYKETIEHLIPKLLYLCNVDPYYEPKSLGIWFDLIEDTLSEMKEKLLEIDRYWEKYSHKKELLH